MTKNRRKNQKGFVLNCGEAQRRWTDEINRRSDEIDEKYRKLREAEADRSAAEEE